ncbi:hypothetical protein CMO96_05090 [Candidatus Woesebacteria bacterium]|nr:hypothetical protein [Candidatus Woesebacteria bacterium]|tara:strand:+ start:1069 stop:1359 length:291 start_codon:yes stop_codon:yes gene_type:complete
MIQVTIGGSVPKVQNITVSTEIIAISFADDIGSASIRTRNDAAFRVYNGALGGAYWTVRAGEVLELDIAPGSDNPAVYIRTDSAGTDTLEILSLAI